MSDPTPRDQLAGIHPKTDLTVFRPSQSQEYAKARLHDRLKARADLVDLASLTAQEVADLAGNQRVLGWLKDPAFAAWLADNDAYAYTALALRETAVAVLADILRADYEPKILTAKDKLKAADMLFQLTGAYPAKSKEVRFMDAELERMPADQVRAELAERRKALAAHLPSV